MTLHSLQGLPVWLALAGVVVAWFFYLKRPSIPAALKHRFSGIYTLLDNKYYLDKINEVVFARGLLAIGRSLYKEGDQTVIDGAVDGSANAMRWLARALRPMQTGYVYHYAFAMILGVLALLTLFVTLSSN
jgi:NADH-quinone oxidoreductase subunit L